MLILELTQVEATGLLTAAMLAVEMGDEVPELAESLHHSALRETMERLAAMLPQSIVDEIRDAAMYLREARPGEVTPPGESGEVAHTTDSAG